MFSPQPLNLAIRTRHPQPRSMPIKHATNSNPKNHTYKILVSYVKTPHPCTITTVC